VSIYPTCINITESAKGTLVDMLDITISAYITKTTTAKIQLTTKLFDKRRAEAYTGFNIVRFPSVWSNLNLGSKLNIITGQFHRLRRIILDEENFIEEMGKTLQDLHKKGFERKTLHAKLRKITSKHNALFGRKSNYMIDAIQRTANLPINDATT